MDNLIQLRLKTKLVISSAISDHHVKTHWFCHKAHQVGETPRVLLEGRLPLFVFTVTTKVSILHLIY